ncbi:hypothetical protein OF83DRAFT_769405 [Amylostereum chailletii]|nr:hypothetical protein OF83DRAFT_769405 [Amylostereum chailletii]
MAPTIWGFDLGEMRWSSFNTRSMMDPRFHLRRERIIAYQLGMLISLAAECTATYSLSKYEDLQNHVQDTYTVANGFPVLDPSVPKALLDNNALIDAEISTIVFCVLVACIFGADFFFLVMFPRRVYPSWYNFGRKFFALLCCAGMFASAIASTVIVATRSARIINVPDSLVPVIVSLYFRPPLQYNSWATNIAYVVLLWIGTLFVFISYVSLVCPRLRGALTSHAAQDDIHVHGRLPRHPFRRRALARLPPRGILEDQGRQSRRQGMSAFSPAPHTFPLYLRTRTHTNAPRISSALSRHTTTPPPFLPTVAGTVSFPFCSVDSAWTAQDPDCPCRIHTFGSTVITTAYYEHRTCTSDEIGSTSDCARERPACGNLRRGLSKLRVGGSHDGRCGWPRLQTGKRRPICDVIFQLVVNLILALSVNFKNKQCDIQPAQLSTMK